MNDNLARASERPVTVLTVAPIGRVELPGVGPWHVHEVTRNSFDIKDSAGIVSNPAVTAPGRGGRGFKRNENVIYADKAIPNIIVTAFNAELGQGK
ncbi:hypothetical protein [Sphingomonas sp. ACRSK]|uniref:hypothetical protein n=1 Tax=Sphingomonas sp. ACRSK TaxID=2918213 RepID=UPI001EF605E8|nr:hypothetical protein [Sphingomonas sp. ACRSK]MCG7348889.1 hypothetical protein [Sphingomonas sp. ACRSK]